MLDTSAVGAAGAVREGAVWGPPPGQWWGSVVVFFSGVRAWSAR